MAPESRDLVITGRNSVAGAGRVTYFTGVERLKSPAAAATTHSVLVDDPTVEPPPPPPPLT